MRRDFRKRFGDILCFAGFGLPALVIWISVVLIPFIFGIWITLTDWNGLAMQIHFVGFENFHDVFSDPTMGTSFIKTVIYAFFTVIASNIMGILLALAVTSGIKGQNLFRIGFFTPNIIGGIILGYIWRFIFLYAFTAVGKGLEIEWMKTSWLTHPTRALIALIIVSSWQLSGYLMVIYIAGLTSVPKDLIDAAYADGASALQIVSTVKLPLIRNSIAICIFLSISRAFMSFDMNLSLTAGGPYKSTELIAYKIYQTAFTSMEFGKGQAQAIVFFVIVAIISLLQVYFTRKGVDEQ
ncbi:MAG: sugar ABC transporter permease [Butyrivibrio sp.]|nr:sugar ABC transporter permease [Butyrivibrio sp.]